MQTPREEKTDLHTFFAIGIYLKAGSSDRARFRSLNTDFL